MFVSYVVALCIAGAVQIRKFNQVALVTLIAIFMIEDLGVSVYLDLYTLLISQNIYVSYYLEQETPRWSPVFCSCTAS